MLMDSGNCAEVVGKSGVVFHGMPGINPSCELLEFVWFGVGQTIEDAQQMHLSDLALAVFESRPFLCDRVGKDVGDLFVL